MAAHKSRHWDFGQLLTYLIQLEDLNLHFELLEEVLDLGAEGAGGLGEDHDPVGGHQLVHGLHGGGGDGRHGGQAPAQLQL